MSESDSGETRWKPALPPGRWIELPDEGWLFVREIEGPPGAPTLILLHGWTATSDLNWFPSFRALGARFHVVAFDHRGHGRGLRTRRRFRLSDCADDAAEVATALGVERFVACGYSMGGAVATLLWERHRARVDGLVLCATASTFFETRADRLRLGLLDPISVAARALPSRGAQALYERLVWTQTKERNYHPWMIDEIRSCHPRLVLDPLDGETVPRRQEEAGRGDGPEEGRQQGGATACIAGDDEDGEEQGGEGEQVAQQRVEGQAGDRRQDHRDDGGPISKK